MSELKNIHLIHEWPTGHSPGGKFSPSLYGKDEISPFEARMIGHVLRGLTTEGISKAMTEIDDKTGKVSNRVSPVFVMTTLKTIFQKTHARNRNHLTVMACENPEKYGQSAGIVTESAVQENLARARRVTEKEELATKAVILEKKEIRLLELIAQNPSVSVLVAETEMKSADIAKMLMCICRKYERVNGLPPDLTKTQNRILSLGGTVTSIASELGMGPHAFTAEMINIYGKFSAAHQARNAEPVNVPALV